VPCAQDEAFPSSRGVPMTGHSGYDGGSSGTRGIYGFSIVIAHQTLKDGKNIGAQSSSMRGRTQTAGVGFLNPS
jgi:hypothetical protein